MKHEISYLNLFGNVKKKTLHVGVLKGGGVGQTPWWISWK